MRMRTKLLTVGLFSAAAMMPLNLALADQVGSASWYALHSKTASGEQMDPSAMTAAHPSLPFGTKVVVENLSNGRSVTVRINDRGPFVHGRIIDVSKAAASSLGMIGSGTAKVRVSTAGGGASASSQGSTAGLRGAMHKAPELIKVAAKQSSRSKVAAAKPRSQSSRVASRERAVRRELAATAKIAPSPRGARGDVVLASAGSSYAVFGGTPGFMKSDTLDGRQSGRRGPNRIVFAR